MSINLTRKRRPYGAQWAEGGTGPLALSLTARSAARPEHKWTDGPSRVCVLCPATALFGAKDRQRSKAAASISPPAEGSSGGGTGVAKEVSPWAWRASATHGVGYYRSSSPLCQPKPSNASSKPSNASSKPELHPPPLASSCRKAIPLPFEQDKQLW